MLIMTVYTYPAKNRNEVIKRRLAQGPQLSDKVKLLGEWSYIGGGRVFRLIEADDPVEVFKATYAWSDLGTIESYAVLPTEQIMGMVAAMAK